MSSRLPIADAAAPGAAPHWPLTRARAWLRSDAIVDSFGAVRSWHNPRAPGFDYPEVAGLWLSALAGGGTAHDLLADRVATRLAARVGAGEVGRDGVAYTFDLGVALAGLLDHRRAGGRDHAQACRAGQHALASALAERRVTSTPLAPRWSTRYGPHMLKLAAVLARLPNACAIAARLFDELGDLHDAGRYLTAPDGGPTYVHAHCYAAEGLWCIARAGGDPRRAGAAALRLTWAADWLADAQRPDGAMPSHHDGRGAHGPARADATAQAIRIWTVTDAARHAGAIVRAWRWLCTCTTAGGAVRYEPDSDDHNAWATIFAMQAAEMIEGAGPTELPW